MSAMELKALAALGPALSATPWTIDDLHSAASSGKLLRTFRNDELIEADAALVRGYWNILAVLDPARYWGLKNSFPYIYSDARKYLAEAFDVPISEVRDAALQISRFVAFEIDRYSSPSKRGYFDRRQRAELIAASGHECRCWYCGYRFPNAVVSAFADGRSPGLKPMLLVDFVTPRGLSATDLQIETDHVQPLAAGGTDELSNLHLACGWCNRGKSSLRLLFEAAKSARVIQHPSLGAITVPASFWAIRVRAARRMCEYAIGCQKTLSTSELVVGPWRSEGAMVPGNLGVFCSKHDPLRQHRIVSARFLRTKAMAPALQN